MPRKSRKNVGLIGLGIIGARAAAGLRAAGWHVFVWNRTPKPVANFLGSPAEVADICEIVQLFVADAQAVFAMIEALGDSLTERHVVICSATIGPEATLEAARMVEARGARFLDAPFTGSRGAAERAQLVYYVGGDEGVYARVKPALEATSKAIVRCGKVGDAATLKVVTNLITAVTTQTLAEALAITRRAGIGPDVFAAAVEQNACRSGVIELKLPKMVTGDYEPHFSLKHMFKDVQLGIHLANALDLEVPATTVTAGVMYGAMNEGWSDLDFSSVFRIYENEFAKLTQRELAAPNVEELPDAKSVAEPLEAKPAEPSAEATPVEIIVLPAAGEGAVPALDGAAMEMEKAPVTGEPAERKPEGGAEFTLVTDEVPADAVVKSAGANEVVEIKAPEPKPEAARVEEAEGVESKMEEGAKAGEIKLDEPKLEVAGPDAPAEAAKDVSRPTAPKVEGVGDAAAKDVDAGTPPKADGEGDATPKPDGEPKPARPFNRILRRFFSPAGR